MNNVFGTNHRKIRIKKSVFLMLEKDRATECHAHLDYPSIVPTFKQPKFKMASLRSALIRDATWHLHRA